MRIVMHEKLSDKLALSIVEVDDLIAKLNFENRFQFIIEIDNKRIFPREKNKFLSFKENNHFYSIKSDTTNEPILVNEILYHEKKLCDKSYIECNNLFNKYLFMFYGAKEDLMIELKRLYNF